MNKGIVIFDIVFAVIFTALGLAAVYGVVIKGAWWHILTVGIASVLVVALVRDIKKEGWNGHTMA